MINNRNIAERILTLGFSPEHRYTRYVKISSIEESIQVTDGVKAINEIIQAFKILITKQRVILDMSAETNDEGTNALMSDYIREQEKLVWMYSAYVTS